MRSCVSHCKILLKTSHFTLLYSDLIPPLISPEYLLVLPSGTFYFIMSTNISNSNQVWVRWIIWRLRRIDFINKNRNRCRNNFPNIKKRSKIATVLQVSDLRIRLSTLTDVANVWKNERNGIKYRNFTLSFRNYKHFCLTQPNGNNTHQVNFLLCFSNYRTATVKVI